ncbi:phosphotransacetylase [Rhodococcus opacus]|uniref:phosphotransacetylase n=1 Tax=Rhodococcus opacus TaxID=37919 RepID=UPI0022364E31|nr:phosphotransacetylase [Rhodococcus opacus]UZG60371.1 phosphotransacetylase [Rhodococcus opacus]
MTTSSQPPQAPIRWAERFAPGAEPIRVVLPEGEDPRVLEAARRLAVEPGPVTPLLVCASVGEARHARKAGVAAETVESLAAGPAGRRIAEIGRARGWSQSTITDYRHRPLYLGAALVDVGAAEACVAGAVHASGDVIRAGLRVLGLAEATSLVCSSFLLVLPDGRTLAFGDCAVIPEPDEQQLAGIAVATAATYRSLTSEEPVVAMLSFSTLGSADHESVRRVRAATGQVRERAPQLAVDGEMQLDAAIVASVAELKAAGSPVAGRANVLVFPNLAAGNIGYKIAQRLGGAEAIGPIIQGLRAPMNDLSRGCSVDDVVNVALISALQARGCLAPDTL